jgi:hypothetical protein
MSHEGGPEPTQRTVAELLAKYGQESGGNAPRRRRRRADDVEDTGAQAIIERVMSESGEMQVIREDTPPPGRTSHRQSRTDFQRPVEPPQRRRQPGQQPNPQQPGTSGPAGPSGPSAGPPTVTTPGPLAGPPSSPRLPAVGPPSSPRLPAVGPPSSPRLPAVGQPPEPPRRGSAAPQPGRRGPEPSRHQQPSQQLPKPSQQPSQQLPQPAPSQPSQPMRQQAPGQRSGVQPSLRSRLEGDNPPPTQTIPPALAAPKAPPKPPPPGMPSGMPPGMPGAMLPIPPEPMTEELPRIPTYPAMKPADQRLPGQDSRTQLTPAVFPPHHEQFPPGPRQPDQDFDPDADYDSGYFDHGYPAEDRVEDGERAYRDLDRGLDGDLDRDLDRDIDEDLAREFDDLDDDREPRSAAREWLMMVGQLAVGVLGGAAVWLGFNWLWGALPQAALVLALAVIAGMVFIVRKIRKAEDLQTTVYAVLVGLLATVSPAALLLLNR